MSQIKVIAMAAILAVSASSAFASQTQYHWHSRWLQSGVQLIEGRNSASHWGYYGSYSGSTPTGRNAIVNTLGN
jgi:hypothetical protein